MGNGAVPRPLAVAAAFLALALPAQAGAATPAPPPKLPARAAIVTVLNTGQRLYGLNAEQELAIASTTKLMTALQTFEHASLQQTFTEPNFHFAPDDSQIYLTPGERMSVHDLMVAMLLPSADDAAKDLAYNVGGGSVSRFVAMMNHGARKLGLTHTHYSTPIGLDTRGNYSSASDLVKLAGYLLEHYPFFAQTVALPSAVLKTGDHPRYVVNRNDLVARFPWIRGVKTGHTRKAGYVLVAEGRRDGMTLLSAVLGTPSEAARDSSTLALLDWGYANFRMATPLTAGAVVARPTANGYSDRHASVIAARNFSWVVPRGSGLRVRLNLPDDISGPLQRGAHVGTATVLDGAHPVGRVGLVLARALPGVGIFTAAGRFITEPITLVVLIVVLAALAGLTLRGRVRRRARSWTA
ncbi:MAG TPA: D-alanyl-D-alanine carboxypeptidase family protein [Solirubrobacteraceae bacterium]|nr:D-alanyl-D-alanine carboxypeptidase family protein [Solirubrobacteraceae bacterium]